MLVGQGVRFFKHGGADAPGLGDALVDVRDFEGDIDDAVAVPG